MNKSNHELDTEYLEKLETIYRQQANEAPSVDIDKQIIAAAYREIEHPNPLKRPEYSWWRRLSLPLYATATFTLTAIATHILFPEPPAIPPGTAPGTVRIEITEPQPAAAVYQPREAKQAPEFVLESKLAEESQSGVTEAERFDNLLAESIAESEPAASAGAKLQQASKPLAQVKSNESVQLAKLEYPDKETWAKEILKMLRKGEYEKAQKELVRFKNAFPDYPIDAQIEALRSM